MTPITLFDCCARVAPPAGPPQRHLRPGTRVRGRYEVRQHLTTTKFNDVYIALDLTTGLLVVLKHARCHGLRADTCCTQYAVVAHEHLMLQRFATYAIPAPQPLEHFMLGSRPCLVMRYVDGQTLEQRRAQRRLSADVAVRAIARAAVLAHRAHCKGYVIHDLKPSNLMLTPVGLVLLDLGAAHSITEERSGGGSVIGTEHFMSPEHRMGLAIPRNDVYALGMCLDTLVDRPSTRLAAIIERATSPLPPYTQRADLLAWQLRLLLTLDACSHLAGSCLL